MDIKPFRRCCFCLFPFCFPVFLRCCLSCSCVSRLSVQAWPSWTSTFPSPTLCLPRYMRLHLIGSSDLSIVELCLPHPHAASSPLFPSMLMLMLQIGSISFSPVTREWHLLGPLLSGLVTLSLRWLFRLPVSSCLKSSPRIHLCNLAASCSNTPTVSTLVVQIWLARVEQPLSNLYETKYSTHKHKHTNVWHAV